MFFFPHPSIWYFELEQEKKGGSYPDRLYTENGRTIVQLDESKAWVYFTQKRGYSSLGSLGRLRVIHRKVRN